MSEILQHYPDDPEKNLKFHQCCEIQELLQEAFETGWELCFQAGGDDGCFNEAFREWMKDHQVFNKRIEPIVDFPIPEEDE